jgi:hypothetical protein
MLSECLLASYNNSTSTKTQQISKSKIRAKPGPQRKKKKHYIKSKIRKEQMHNCNEYVIPHDKDISERVNNCNTTNYDGKANFFRKQQEQ